MLCVTPYYDKCLVEAINKKNKNTTFVSISFHRDPKYFIDNNIHNKAGLIDFMI